MTNVFLFGTLCWPELLHRVAGQTCPEGQAALLQGFQVSWAKGHGFPAIHQVKSTAAHGMVLCGCDATVLARLDHYESGFGYRLHPVEVKGLRGRCRRKSTYHLRVFWLERSGVLMIGCMITVPYPMRRLRKL